jgi:hypothetical protein
MSCLGFLSLGILSIMYILFLGLHETVGPCVRQVQRAYYPSSLHTSFLYSALTFRGGLYVGIGIARATRNLLEPESLTLRGQEPFRLFGQVTVPRSG